MLRNKGIELRKLFKPIPGKKKYHRRKFRCKGIGSTEYSEIVKLISSLFCSYFLSKNQFFKKIITVGNYGNREELFQKSYFFEKQNRNFSVHLL